MFYTAWICFHNIFYQAQLYNLCFTQHGFTFIICFIKLSCTICAVHSMDLLSYYFFKFKGTIFYYIQHGCNFSIFLSNSTAQFVLYKACIHFHNIFYQTQLYNLCFTQHGFAFIIFFIKLNCTICVLHSMDSLS